MGSRGSGTYGGGKSISGGSLMSGEYLRIYFYFLVGSFSIYSLAFICTKRECCLCIELLKPKVVSNESTIHTYMRYFHAVLRKFAYANSNFQNKFLFCVPIPLMKRQGVANIFHARYFILTMSVYSLVIARETGR
jgi:hypothetical protein